MSHPVILLLAAGRSARMRGRDKLLEPVEGEALLRRQARRAAAAAPTIVVLPQGAEARAATLAGLGVTTAEVGTDAPALSTSLAAGLAALPAAASGALVMLADMPEIDTADLERLLARHADAPGAIVRAATADGAPGNPVLFPAALFPALARLDGDNGARDLLRAPPVAVDLVTLPGRHAAIDLDTPEDWDAWRGTGDRAP